MREAVSRRFSHTEDEFPDLLLLDGGKAHVAVIRKLFDEMNISTPVFGMVKDDYHKTRSLTDDKNEISIAKEQAVYQLIFKIQEEVHRYTVSRMTSAKRKTIKKSVLEEIDGIGPAKAKALLSHFGGLSGMKNADANELMTVKGISEKDASLITDYFENRQSKSKG